MADGRADSGPEGLIEVETGPVIDVPLTGSAAETLTGAGTDGPPPPNWRRAMGIALVVGTVLGVSVAMLRISADDDTSPTASTSPGDELASAITTPPTLAPLGTLPPPDFVTTAPITTVPEVMRPVYEEIPGVVLGELVQYDIAPAIARLGDDVPRRSETHVELGNAGFVVDVTIERDPVRDRYRVVLESRGDSQVAIVDGPAGVTYVNPRADEWVEVPNAEIIAGSDAADVNEYFDRLLLGPLRPDTFDAPTTRGRGLVRIGGIGVAREFRTSISGALIPEWQLYAFSPVFEFPVEDRPSVLDYAVYVTEDGRIAQVDGVASVGDVAQSVQHRLTLLEEAPVVEVPPTTPSATTAPPADSAPANAP